MTEQTLARAVVDGSSARQLSSLLSAAYAGAPAKQRLMAAGRPWIAPLGAVVAEIPENARLLDMGCGAGFLLSLAVKLRGVREAVGVDVDRNALSVAAAATSGLAAETDIRLHALDDWAQVGFEEFDVVTLVDVMHHVPWEQRSGLLTQLLSRVRPGGLFIYKDIAERPRWRARANYLHDLILTGERVRLSPVASIEKAASEGGFHLVRSESYHLFWYGHDLRVFQRPD